MVTTRPPGREDYAIEHLLADVDALIEASGARETLLVAHDWGGIVAWYYAMRRPRALPPLSRLVVMNAPHPACFEAALGLRQLLRSWYVLAFQVPGLAEWLLTRLGPDWSGRIIRESAAHPERILDDADMTHYRRSVEAPGAATAMLSWYRAAMRGGGFRRQRALGYPRIDVPTLVIWGEQDLALLRETTAGTAEHVPGLVLRYLPQASHWVQQDEPERVNAMLAAWLRDRPVPHAPGATGDLG